MRTTIALLTVVLLLAAWPARSQVPPPFISYQGLLQDAAGNPVQDGVYSLTFRLYGVPEGGAPLWEETHDVEIANGVFSALLGGMQPLHFESDVLWITLAVGGEEVVMPRRRIGSVPFALVASSLSSPGGSIKMGDCEPGGTDPCLKWDTKDGFNLRGDASFSVRAVFHDFEATSATVKSFSVDNSVEFGPSCVPGSGDACLEWNRETGLNARCPAGAESCLDVDGPVEFGDCGPGGTGACLEWDTREGLNLRGDASFSSVISDELLARLVQGGIVTGTEAAYFPILNVDRAFLQSAFELGKFRFEYRPDILEVTTGTAPVIRFDARADKAAVHIDGTLQADKVQASEIEANVKNFRIDHPLDPAGKYLYHTSVESPDMLNLYNGTVTLDASGQALVQLPAYFEVLNRDFRYQLTCIGGFAPVYVAEKISGNRFKIAGGVPGLEVSWQVTGVRKDPYAEAHRSPVEADKPAGERGTYLHPELYGQPSVRR